MEITKTNDTIKKLSKFLKKNLAIKAEKGIYEFSKEYSIENAAFVCAKGRTTRMDLTEIEAEYEKHKSYSFLSTFWGVIADCDINSEVLRWMGSARFTVWGVYRVLCPVNYLGSIMYTGQKVGNKQDVDNLDE